ncbi:MAG: HPF/RaiA family ribosome-associated protein [Candidatus Omnitrophota bacterium]
MQEPLEIIFRHAPKNTQLEGYILEQSKHLEKFFQRVVSCKVTVDKPQKSGLPAGLYKVRVDVGLPRRREIIIKKEAKISATFDEICVLIKEAFKAAARELEEIKEREFLPKRLSLEEVLEGK